MTETTEEQESIIFVTTIGIGAYALAVYSLPKMLLDIVTLAALYFAPWAF